MIRTLLAGAMLSVISVVSASAAVVVYDEGVSGDAPPIAPTGNLGFSTPLNPNQALGALSPGQNIVNGSVQGGTVDNVDVYSFTVATPWTLDVLSYTTGNNNTTSTFRLHSAGALTVGDRLADSVISGPQLDIFAGLNAAGTYILSIFESGSTTPATYSFSVTTPNAVVPLPAAAPLFIAGLAGLGFLRRRRKNCA